MKGIIFTNLPDSFPSLAFGSGSIEKEDTYRYAQRTADGEMRRIEYIGSVIKISCKFSLLTRSQFALLWNETIKEYFPVSFDWKGTRVTKNFYAGNLTSTPFRLGPDGNPLYYSDVTFNIVSMETLKDG